MYFIFSKFVFFYEILSSAESVRQMLSFCRSEGCEEKEFFSEMHWFSEYVACGLQRAFWSACNH